MVLLVGWLVLAAALCFGCTKPGAGAPRSQSGVSVATAPTATLPTTHRAEAPPTDPVTPAVEPAPEASPPSDPCSGDDREVVDKVRSGEGLSSKAWSELSPGVVRDVAAGRPLVLLVYVPLCSNLQIWCGSRYAGDPAGLNTNIYWGAVFGARRFFDDYNTPYERVEATRGEAPDLERIVYRQRVSGEPWGKPGEKVEQVVVLQAVHGSHINGAVERFWTTATRGGCVSFQDGERERTERVHVVGYAGHNRLMDGIRLPAAPSTEEAHPIPSFVLACFSERYFGPSLRRVGARPLVTTRSYMAPEGYLVRALAEGLALNESPEALRQRAARVQRAWQKTLSPFQSAWIFWPFES
jgi:hypothetical protein